MKKVLIVDDSKFARANTKKFLESLGYDVVGEAVDGLDGIKKMLDLSPELIITDIEMPNLDGIGMLKKIRNHENDIKIVVVSSIVNSQMVHEVTSLGASVVKKPLKEQTLKHAIELLYN